MLNVTIIFYVLYKITSKKIWLTNYWTKLKYFGYILLVMVWFPLSCKIVSQMQFGISVRIQSDSDY